MKPERILTATEKFLTEWSKKGIVQIDEIIKLQEEAAEEIRRQSAKQSSRATVYAAAIRLLKDAEKFNPHRPALHGAHRGADGYISICDGFRFLQLRQETAPDLPERSRDLPEYIDAARLWNYNSPYHSDPVHLPELSELRAYIKTERARLKALKDKSAPLWKLPTDSGALVYVNACFLLDMMEALPDATVTAADKRTQLSSLIFEAQNGRGLLLPVRPPEEGAPRC